ncbi:tyrosine-type recombinase/integrase [Nocardioides marmoraquaticus]
MTPSLDSGRSWTPATPQAWTTAIEQWRRHLRTETDVAASTIQTRTDHLYRTARALAAADPWAVDEQTLLQYFDAQEWQRETRRGHRASLRAFYAWGATAGHVDQSPALALPRVRPGKPRPRPLPDSGYRVGRLAASPRDLLMLRLGAELGLRRMEIAQLHTRDYIEDFEGLSVLVHGKGDRERVVPVPDGLEPVLRALPAGYVFPGDDHGHLSPRWVGTVVARLLPPGYTCHTLRHRFATRTHQATGGDWDAVRELLGHASMETTRAYVFTDRSRLRAAVNDAA